jgi:plasmid maintenance system antidote protein VapI
MNLQAKYDLAKIEGKDEKKELFNIIKLTVDKQLQKA